VTDPTFRTVEQMLADLNHALEVLSELERLPKPLCPAGELRRKTCEYVAHQAIQELNAAKAAKALIERAKEPA
jgi:hypothetical protein